MPRISRSIVVESDGESVGVSAPAPTTAAVTVINSDSDSDSIPAIKSRRRNRNRATIQSASDTENSSIINNTRRQSANTKSTAASANRSEELLESKYNNNDNNNRNSNNKSSAAVIINDESDSDSPPIVKKHSQQRRKRTIETDSDSEYDDGSVTTENSVSQSQNSSPAASISTGKYSLRNKQSSASSTRQKSQDALLAEISAKRLRSQRKRLFQENGGSAAGESSVITELAEKLLDPTDEDNNNRLVAADLQNEYELASDSNSDFAAELIVKKKSNRTSATKKPAARRQKQKPAAKRQKGPRLIDDPVDNSVGDYYSDSDGFIVNSSDDDDDGDNSVLDYIAIDNERDAEIAEANGMKDSDLADMDEEALLNSVRSSLPDPVIAFQLWLRYLCTVLVDSEWAEFVETDLSARTTYKPAIQVIEDKFNVKTEQWVNSAGWNTANRAEFRNQLIHLPYSTTEPLMINSDIVTTETQCETCSRQHQAVYRINFYGVQYNSTALKYPFKSSNILLSNEYSKSSYIVGELCHQRIKLYHSMHHFKFHVMVGLLFEIDKLSELANNNPAALVETLINGNNTVSRRLFNHYFNIWQELDRLAGQYSEGDSRASKIDINWLSTLYEFNTETCALELFKYHKNKNNTIQKKSKSTAATAAAAAESIDSDSNSDSNSSTPMPISKNIAAVNSNSKQKQKQQQIIEFNSPQANRSITSPTTPAAVPTNVSHSRQLLIRQFASKTTTAELDYLIQLLTTDNQQYLKAKFNSNSNSI